MSSSASSAACSLSGIVCLLARAGQVEHEAAPAPVALALAEADRDVIVAEHLAGDEESEAASVPAAAPGDERLQTRVLWSRVDAWAVIAHGYQWLGHLDLDGRLFGAGVPQPELAVDQKVVDRKRVV